MFYYPASRLSGLADANINKSGNVQYLYNGDIMKSKTIIIILSSLLIISLAFNALMIYRELRWVNPDWFDSKNELQIGDMAPDFSVLLLNGETFTLSDYRGKMIVLDFWATWCGPCVEKMPTIQILSEQYESSVIFVGMNVGEDSDLVQDFINKTDFTYLIGLDEQGDIFINLYPSIAIPYLVIINEEGVISYISVGGSDSMYEPSTSSG
jgi:thiol-disulfide isomerase/thioredoxin